MIALLLLGLLACGRPVTPDAGTAGAGFPHPTDYEQGHGADAVAEGAACASCHGLAEGDPVKGATPTAPACWSCHPYPHTAELRPGEVHGALWAARDTSASADEVGCDDCHGAAGELAPAEQTGGQCTACHATYPHPSGWDAASGHGAATRARGTAAGCAACHGAAGDETEPTCASCHPAYPHAEGWGEGSGHGAAAIAGQDCGEACHVNTADGVDRQPCASCHDVYPHVEGWSTSHATLTQRRGLTACEGCHPAGELSGPEIPSSCAPACHATVPR